jgi:hypothetical protein
MAGAARARRRGSSVEDLPVPSAEPGRREIQELLAQYDAPAYIRRARGVEEALERLLAAGRTKRLEWLKMVRLLVGELRAMAGGGLADHPALRPLLDDESLAGLDRLHAELAPKLRVPVEQTTSARPLRRKAREVIEALERFNRRWRRHLDDLDLGIVNALREGYNRYYLLEKECALRSAALARRGFQPLPPLTLAEVEEQLPMLPVPRLRG